LLGDRPVTGRASFEYWTSGERFYVRARAARDLGLSGDIEASFDGYESRLLLAGDGLLIREDGSVLPVHSPIPSPIQLPLYFLGAASASCPTCIGALDKLADQDTWESALERGRGHAGRILLSGPNTWRSGRTYYSVSVNPDGVPNRIEWRAERENLLVLVEMRAFRSFAGLGAFPAELTMTAFNESGEPEAKIVYHVQELRTNAGSEHLEYRVPEDRADMIWENQERRFSKHFDASDAD
jgi:hypothetical protein